MLACNFMSFIITGLERAHILNQKAATFSGGPFVFAWDIIISVALTNDFHSCER